MIRIFALHIPELSRISVIRHVIMDSALGVHAPAFDPSA